MDAIGPFGYALGLIPGLLAIFGNLAGGVWTLGATVFLGLICVADWFVQDDPRPMTSRDNDRTPDVVLVLHVVVNTLAIATLIFGACWPTLSRGRVNDAALSTGLNAAISGIVVAHELIHRRGRTWRRLGIWNLFLVNYTYFYIEHVRGHHKNVGSRRDPSTARPGESLYVYILRSIPQQFWCALRLEADRLGRAGRWRFGPANFVVAASVFQVAFIVFLHLTLGLRASFAFVWQGTIAVVLLQAVNYVQHYGLERAPGSRIEPAHSWQSDRISSRFLLLELPRHADHHCRSGRPYHQLVSHAESPTLPLGLLGTIPLLLIPPLWSRVASGILARTSAAAMGPEHLVHPAHDRPRPRSTPATIQSESLASFGLPTSQSDQPASGSGLASSG